jgi:hypothetical protein
VQKGKEQLTTHSARQNCNCTLFAAVMYPGAAGKTECKVCDVVNVSHLYEYLAVTETHVTGDVTLAGATA